MDRRVVRLCRLRLIEHYAPKLEACLEALEGTDLARTGAPANSIEGIVQHMLAHLRLAAAWTGEDEQTAELVPTDIRAYFPVRGATPDEMRSDAEQCFARLNQALQRLETGGPREAGGLDLQRLLHLVEHFSYHLGQVVLMAKVATGKEFGFAQAGLNEARLRELEEHAQQQDC